MKIKDEGSAMNKQQFGSGNAKRNLGKLLANGSYG